MAYTLSQLLEGMTIEQAEEELLELLQDQGIQTTDWKVGSPELTMLKLDAYVYSTLVNRVAQTTKNSINSLSSGSALTYLADSHFNNQRIESSFTEGYMVVTGSSANVPKTFQEKEMIVTDGTYNFYNLSQFTIDNTTQYVTTSFIAELPGSEYNIPINSDLSLVGSEVGFSVSNPVYTYGISGSWITSYGTDDESDNSLRNRNAVKYSSFQTGDVTSDRVTLLVLSASSDVEYVSVDDTNPRGPFTVDVYLSKATETVSTGIVNTVNDRLKNAFWGNSTNGLVLAIAATPVTFARTITVYYSKDAFLPDVVQQVEDVCNAWVASIPIGGNNYSPYGTNIAHVYDLITDINGVDGVQKVSISDDSDLSLYVYQKLVAPTDWNSLITYQKLALR
jgi:hypothetical protein